MVVAMVLAFSLAGGVAGCGSSSSSGSGTPHVHFAKTKFLLHAGLAFGAFHRYIYKPYRAGRFTPVSSHKLAIVKAGAAGLFAYHEIKIALVDARSSSTLSKLVSPLTALESKMRSLGSGLKSGKLDGSAISKANSSVSSIGRRAPAVVRRSRTLQPPRSDDRAPPALRSASPVYRCEIQRAQMIKYIATEAQTRTIEVRHDRARVEYAPISGDAQQVSRAAGSALSGDRWLVLYDEEIVVQRRWVARERVRLATHLVIEDRGISGDLRGEQLAIDTTRHMEDDDG